MRYTIQQVSKLAGVSVRTLHYYDEIELLSPAYVQENGYRVYEDKELSILQQILFFRELDFPLEQIKKIIMSPHYNSIEALTDQKKLLELKKERLNNLIKTIEKTIVEMKGGEIMSNDDKYSVFNDPTYQKHKDEVEERWGNTVAYKQSIERVGNMSKEDMERIGKEAEAIYSEIAKLMQQGSSFDSVEIQDQIELHYDNLRNFYEPNYEMYKGLGQMYVDDFRFTEFYEKKAEGLAVFMRDAMVFFADAHLQKQV